mgnify:CR=1 FL=1
MELEEFVKQTLNQIIDGVRLSQEYAQSVDATVNPQTGYIKDDATDVEFDIAVTSSESDTTEGNLSIQIASLGGKGGKRKGSEDIVENRVRFSVSLSLPVQPTSTTEE